MKYLLKFNEAEETPKILSSERIEEINKDISLTSAKLDDIVEKYNSLYSELEEFTTKSQTNNQIDDAFVDLKTFLDKIDESKKLLGKISGKLEDYTKEGSKYLS